MSELKDYGNSLVFTKRRSEAQAKVRQIQRLRSSLASAVQAECKVLSDEQSSEH